MMDQTSSEISSQQRGDGKAGLKAPSYLVGIGASAGGLDALERFFDHMPAQTGMAFVIVQHLSPDFKSLLNELLARHTSMPIHTVRHLIEVQPDNIYIIPPGKNITLSKGKLLLKTPDRAAGLNFPIDIFLSSLAKDAGSKAIAVILSGTGSDGSRALKDIRAAGGKVFVQSEESSDFDGMPKSALATGQVNCNLPVEHLPLKILEETGHVPAGGPHGHLNEENVYSVIFRLLKNKYNLDFAFYKQNTILRRIERREAVNRCTDIESYLKLLHDNETELDLLYRDLLIEVTQFNRDPDAFEDIRRKVLPEILGRAKAGEDVRIWVPGCATGEEAYTFAILCAEYCHKQGKNCAVKIFATDVHRGSLDFAGKGVYSAKSLEALPRPLRARYFVRKNAEYHVSSAIRRMVLFAPHNLLRDPPFTKVDLISCRNVLIYFESPAQQRILSLFHFALKPKSYLFLGPSETVRELGGDYEIINRRWRIYKKMRNTNLLSRAPLEPPLPLYKLSSKPVPQAAPSPDGGAAWSVPQTYAALLKKYVPPSILVNSRFELLHILGDARRMLRLPDGRMSTDIFKMVDGDLRIALSAALKKAEQEKSGVVLSNVSVRGESGDELLNLIVDPVEDKAYNAVNYLVSFEVHGRKEGKISVDASAELPGDSARLVEHLEKELGYTKETLQNTIEELETSNEELQSANEELVASNEELQSTNEELHSVNEELFTVNAEHQEKIAELLQLTNDMNNMLKNTEIGTVFLDQNLCIRKFTPAVVEAFNLLPQDTGRPISHISNNLNIQGLQPDIQKVIATGKVSERKLKSRKGRHFLMRILPYRNEVGLTEGAVITFIDVTTLHQVEEALRLAQAQLEKRVDERTAELRRSEERLDLAVKAGQTGIWDWPDMSKNAQWWSPSLYAALGFVPGDIKPSLSTFRALTHKEDKDRLNTALAGAERSFSVEYRLRTKSGEYRWFNMRGQMLSRKSDALRRMSGTLVNIHEHKRMEGIISDSERKFRRVFETSTSAMILFDAQNRVIMHNPMAETLFGYTSAEFGRVQLSDLLPERFRQGHVRHEQRYRRTPYDRPMGTGVELFGVRKDGREVPIEIALTQIDDRDGGKIMAAIVDITERKKIKDMLIQKTQDLQRSNRDLEQFAYVASHDLQEPLRMVASFCQKLGHHYGQDTDPDVQQYINFAVDGAKRMQSLVDALLSYARFGKRDVEKETVDLNEVLATVLHDLAAKIQDEKAVVKVARLPNVVANKIQMTQLFQNLIANGLKFRGTKPPAIHVSARRSGKCWEFSVKDNGIGIEEAYWDRIFVIFQRLHERGKYPGTGIGLSICKKIVENYNGKIWVESQPGKGTAFYFTLDTGDTAP